MMLARRLRSRTASLCRRAPREYPIAGSHSAPLFVRRDSSSSGFSSLLAEVANLSYAASRLENQKMHKLVKDEPKKREPRKPPALEPYATPAVASHAVEGPRAKEALAGKSFAVISTAGSQYKVTEGDMLYVNKLSDAEVGQEYAFDDVLLVGSSEATVIGRPTVPNARVIAAVEEQTKDAKVLVFKKKRRKGYKRTKGFRRSITVLRIERIEHDWNSLELPETLPPVPEVVANALELRNGEARIESNVVTLTDPQRTDGMEEDVVGEKTV